MSEVLSDGSPVKSRAQGHTVKFSARNAWNPGLGEQPMTIQEAMKKAVEGGYHLNDSDGMDTDEAGANRECSAWTRNDTDSTWVAGVKEALLDPHFWRALGLALGWHAGVETKYLGSSQSIRFLRNES
jgi:hypothetical protein